METGGDISQVHNLLEQAQQVAGRRWRGYLDNTLGIIVGVQIKLGDIEGALQTAKSIKNDMQRALALSAVAVAQMRARERALAADTFRLAERAAQASKPEVYRTSALLILASAQAQAGDVVAALETLKAIAQDSGGDKAMAEIAVAQAQAGDTEGARHTAEALTDDFKATTALPAIAVALVKRGDRTAATQAIEQALQAAAAIHDASAKAWALREIAAAQAGLGDRASAAATFQQALQAADGIEKESGKSLALNIIAMAQLEAEDIEAALETARRVSDSTFKGLVLVAIAYSQSERSVPGASETCQEALEIARSIEDDFWRDLIRARVAWAKVQQEDITAARQILSVVSDDVCKVDILNAIATSQARAGDWPATTETFLEALATANGVKQHYMRVLALGKIAHDQTLAGDAAVALTWANKRRSRLEKADGLVHIALGLLRRIEAETVPGVSQDA